MWAQEILLVFFLINIALKMIYMPSVLQSSKREEDGGEIGGSGVHFTLCIGETPSQSSEEQSEQPMVSQHI